MTSRCRSVPLVISSTFVDKEATQQSIGVWEGQNIMGKVLKLWMESTGTALPKHRNYLKQIILFW